jgi:Family of unknown function (DUF5985)
MSLVSVFIVGADTLGFLVAALLFLRARSRTQDYLFACFGGAFALLALDEFAFVMERARGAGSVLSDLLRLAAFAVALAAVGYRSFERQRF